MPLAVAAASIVGDAVVHNSSIHRRRCREACCGGDSGLGVGGQRKWWLWLGQRQAAMMAWAVVVARVDDSFLLRIGKAIFHSKHTINDR